MKNNFYEFHYIVVKNRTEKGIVKENEYENDKG